MPAAGSSGERAGQIVDLVVDSGMGCGDVAGHADVGLADFDETAPAGQQLQRSIDEIPAEAVEHHVHALPVGGAAEGVDESQRARRGDVPSGSIPRLVEHVMFVRVGGGENLRTKVDGRSGWRPDRHLRRQRG